MRHRTAWIALLACGLAAAACRSPRRPPAPAGPPPRTPAHELAAVPLDAGPPRLLPYLEKYPLGSLGRRKDLLARDTERSLHLLQVALPLPAERRPTRTTIAYVLTGRGRVVIDGREFPAAPGAAFRVDPGRAWSVLPDEGEPLVAILYHEPPLLGADDALPAD